MQEVRKQGVNLFKNFGQVYAGQMTLNRGVVDVREYETYKPPLEAYLSEPEGKLKIKWISIDGEPDKAFNEFMEILLTNEEEIKIKE